VRAWWRRRTCSTASPVPWTASPSTTGLHGGRTCATHSGGDAATRVRLFDDSTNMVHAEPRQLSSSSCLCAGDFNDLEPHLGDYPDIDLW